MSKPEKDKQIRKKVRDNAANVLTFFNLIFGVISIIGSIHGRFRWAVAFIGLAGLADRYDGKVARYMGTESPLGVQLDSLGDAVSFGIAPSLLVYMIFSPDEFGTARSIFHIVIALVFIGCGIYRLARYNITGVDEDNNYAGLPITAAGMILAFTALLYRDLSFWVYAVLMLLLSVLMVSKVKIRKT